MRWSILVLQVLDVVARRSGRRALPSDHELCVVGTMDYTTVSFAYGGLEQGTVFSMSSSFVL